MPVMLTDEQAEKLDELLETAGWACEGPAWVKTQEALAIVRSLTREPAPAVSSEFELSAFGKALLAGGTLEDAFAAEGVRLDPAPAPRPHRELMEEAREALVRSCAYVHENRSDIVTDNQELAQRIDAALASAQPCAAPGEPSQEDFDGMQRWLDDALRRCRDDDHKRLKYLQADVRILAAARRWVARAAPGEAGELIDDTRPAGIASFEDHVKAAVRDLNRGAVRWVIRWLQTLKAAPAPAPSEAGELVHEQEALYQGGDELADGRLLVTMRLRRDDVIRVYRHRAPEREGGDPDVR